MMSRGGISVIMSTQLRTALQSAPQDINYLVITSLSAWGSFFLAHVQNQQPGCSCTNLCGSLVEENVRVRDLRSQNTGHRCHCPTAVLKLSLAVPRQGLGVRAKAQGIKSWYWVMNAITSD